MANATRVCSKHFRDGIPYATLGEKFEEYVDPMKRRIISRKSSDKATDGSECTRCSELVQELQQLKAAIASTHFIVFAAFRRITRLYLTIQAFQHTKYCSHLT